MKKSIVCVSLGMLLLTGCNEPQQYQKVTGEVVDKHISGSRFGDEYYISVSYPVGSGKFAIYDYDVGDKVNYDSYNIKEKVTVYENDHGVGEITK